MHACNIVVVLVDSVMRACMCMGVSARTHLRVHKHGKMRDVAITMCGLCCVQCARKRRERKREKESERERKRERKRVGSGSHLRELIRTGDDGRMCDSLSVF